MASTDVSMFGIWQALPLRGWWADNGGIVFATHSIAVAHAQLLQIQPFVRDDGFGYVVREIGEDGMPRSNA